LSNIRVTYSGLIAFAVGLGSLITGFAFTLIVTRRLTPEEFGVWALIGSMVSYFLISETIITFWSRRQIARNEQVGKTSLVSSIAFGFTVIPIYIGYVIVVSEGSNTNLDILILGLILLPVYFVNTGITSINLASKPQAVSYGNIIFEILKIPIALGLVVYFDLGVVGVIFAVFFAFLIRIVIQTYYARNYLKNRFSFSTVKRWLKLSWFPLYGLIIQYLKSVDIVLYSVIIGSVIGVAYYSIAMVFARILTNASSMSQGLYAKLLADGSHDYLRENFIRTLYLAIPLLGIIIIFSKPVVFALNPQYEEAYPIAIILGFALFFDMISGILVISISATDKTDAVNNPKFSNLLKSRMFHVSTVEIVHSVVYLVLLIPGLIILKIQDSSEINLVTWWATCGILTAIPFFIYWSIVIKKYIKFVFPAKETSKYILGTLGFIAVFFLTSDYFISYEISIYAFLPGVIIQFIICSLTYLGITYLIDEKTRILVKSVINEIK